MPSTPLVDVIIVGAGPAGLSAALILGRCRRRVLLVDTDRPRNGASRALHGFLTRDGIAPGELRRIAREQLARYETVRLEHAEATAARPLQQGFEVTFDDSRRACCRRLLLATGVVDELPPLAGIEALYGRSVFHCPYCDGWEVRDQPLAVYARGKAAHGLALALRAWSDDVMLCTDGPSRLTSRQLEDLTRHRIAVRRERVARLDGHDGQLEHIVFTNGDAVPRRALFFSTRQRQGSLLAASLGCAFTRKGAVNTGEYEATNIPGLYVAGDASRLVQLAIVAAAEGAKAAFAIHTALMDADRRR